MIKEIEFKDQKNILWINGINYFIDANIEDVEKIYPSWPVAATRGDVSKRGLFARVEFEGKKYTVLSGRAENTKGDLLSWKINTRAGGDTRYGLNKFMKKAFGKYGGIQVELVSQNAMTYRVL